jgi:hypothetical protein
MQSSATRIVSQQDLILGTTMNDLGIVMDSWSQTITVDVITLPMITSTPCKMLADSDGGS